MGFGVSGFGLFLKKRGQWGCLGHGPVPHVPADAKLETLNPKPLEKPRHGSGIPSRGRSGCFGCRPKCLCLHTKGLGFRVWGLGSMYRNRENLGLKVLPIDDIFGRTCSSLKP